ncbi:MAG: CPBP family intramembrane metalloprotease [Dehalococcoidia bacterium]|nr:CPBP family intramembrane metalloprotease [Dehalococcoidia bacterium]
MTSYPVDDFPRQTGETPPPTPYGGVRWGAREIVIGSVAVLISLFVFLAITSAILAAIGYDSDSAEALVAQVITSLIWDIGIVFIVYKLVSSRGASWRDLGLRPLQRWSLPGVIVLGYVGAVFLVQAYGLALDALGLDDLLPDQQLPDEIYSHDGILIGFAIAGVTIVPFAEELFFRGFFFAGLRRRLGFVLAALISGFVFSLAHADPGLIIPFTGVGMVLSYTYERTGSLYAPIGMHILFNLVSFLVLILIPEARNN